MIFGTMLRNRERKNAFHGKEWDGIFVLSRHDFTSLAGMSVLKRVK